MATGHPWQDDPVDCRSSKRGPGMLGIETPLSRAALHRPGGEADLSEGNLRRDLQAAALASGAFCRHATAGEPICDPRGALGCGHGRSKPPTGRDRCGDPPAARRSEEHTSELQSQFHLVCRLLLEKKKKKKTRKQ